MPPNTIERLQAEGKSLSERLRLTCAYSLALRAAAAEVCEDSLRLLLRGSCRTREAWTGCEVEDPLHPA
jgi:hypothetical protein